MSHGTGTRVYALRLSVACLLIDSSVFIIVIFICQKETGQQDIKCAKSYLTKQINRAVELTR